MLIHRTKKDTHEFFGWSTSCPISSLPAVLAEGSIRTSAPAIRRGGETGPLLSTACSLGTEYLERGAASPRHTTMLFLTPSLNLNGFCSNSNFYLTLGNSFSEKFNNFRLEISAKLRMINLTYSGIFCEKC